MAVIIFREQIRNRPPHVPKKALGNFRVVHDAARERWQEGQGIVAAALLKFLAELGRPVLSADLVAVYKRVVERPALPGERAEVVENFLHEARPMRVERLLAELVALQTGCLG